MDKGNEAFPVYERNKGLRSYGIQEILNIIVNGIGIEDKACESIPINIENNCTFVVDSSKLKSVSDIRSDDCGVWRNNGVRPCLVSWKNNTATVIAHGMKSKNLLQEDDYYLVERSYFIHKSHTDFCKIITVVRGMS